MPASEALPHRRPPSTSRRRCQPSPRQRGWSGMAPADCHDSDWDSQLPLQAQAAAPLSNRRRSRKVATLVAGLEPGASRRRPRTITRSSSQAVRRGFLPLCEMACGWRDRRITHTRATAAAAAVPGAAIESAHRVTDAVPSMQPHSPPQLGERHTAPRLVPPQCKALHGSSGIAITPPPLAAASAPFRLPHRS